MSGTVKEVDAALLWLQRESSKFGHIVLIAGNHDFFFEELDKEAPGVSSAWCSLHNVTYLNDSGVTIDGVKFWGSPVQPWFHDWAFNRERGAEIRKHWDKIPDDTDVLITHGPPSNVLDYTKGGKYVGCTDLRDTIEWRVFPKIHVFGHIHEGYGRATRPGLPIEYFNASYMDHRYRPVNKPWVHEL